MKGRPVVAEETVSRPGIHLDLERLLEPPERLFQPANLVHRDHAIGLAEETEHGTLDAWGVVEGGGWGVGGDAAAIEGNGDLDGSGMPARREEGDTPAHTEAQDPDPIAAHLREGLEVLDDHPHLGHESGVVEALDIADG